MLTLKLEHMPTLAALLEKDLGLREDETVLILMLMNTEEKASELYTWVMDQLQDGIPNCTSTELINQVCRIDKKYGTAVTYEPVYFDEHGNPCDEYGNLLDDEE